MRKCFLIISLLFSFSFTNSQELYVFTEPASNMPAHTNYKQTNINLYAELLAEQLMDIKKYYIDLAPAVQFIFNSNARLNIGYRFQVSGTMQRMATNSLQLSFERTFLNALNKRT